MLEFSPFKLGTFQWTFPICYPLDFSFPFLLVIGSFSVLLILLSVFSLLFLLYIPTINQTHVHLTTAIHKKNHNTYSQYILVELVMIFLVNENLVLTHQTSKLILFDQTGLSIGVG